MSHHRLTQRERLLRQVTEKEWTQQVVDLAKTFGWRIHHSRMAWSATGRPMTALQGHQGLLDLLMVKPPRVVFMELKRQGVKKLSDDQEIWLSLLQRCPGVEAYVCRPGDIALVTGILSGRPVVLLDEGQQALRLAEARG